MISLFINTAYAAEVECVICENVVNNIINPIIALLFGFALIAFLYGMLEFIQGGTNDKEVEKGKQHMMYGILGLVVMVGARGILEIIKGTIASL